LIHECVHILNDDPINQKKIQSISEVPFILSNIVRTTDNRERIKKEFGSVEEFNQLLAEAEEVYSNAEKLLPQLNFYITSLSTMKDQGIARIYSQHPEKQKELTEILLSFPKEDVDKLWTFMNRVRNAGLSSDNIASKVLMDTSDEVNWDAIDRLSTSSRKDALYYVQRFFPAWTRATEYRADELAILNSEHPESLIELVDTWVSKVQKSGIVSEEQWNARGGKMHLFPPYRQFAIDEFISERRERGR